VDQDPTETAAEYFGEIEKELKKMSESERKTGKRSLNTAGDISTSGEVRLELPGGSVMLPLIEGTLGEKALDIRGLKAETGYICLDEGLANTGTCLSRITFVDGEKGILKYRGYPIEQVAEKADIVETALLLFNGEFPSKEEKADFCRRLRKHGLLHEGLRHHFEGFPPGAHPMAILSAMINASSCYREELLERDTEEDILDSAALLISKVRTIAAFSYKKSRGEPVVYPNPELDYCENFLHMMFSLPYAEYEPSPEMARALHLFMILHADHEQNCSTTTARMVGSSGANMFASVAAAVCALWGRLHGGANSAVIEMLKDIADGVDSVKSVIEKAKKGESPLWGFGHRVYKSNDPRVKLLKKASEDLLHALGSNDPLFEIAKELETVAINDSFFVERRLYPNLDFYSGILLRAVGIPLEMFTVMFAIGRMPGWIANWIEVAQSRSKIYRPRQIYVGVPEREIL